MNRAKRIPGAQLIGTMKTGDLASPVSWFWPTTEHLSFAVPDPVMRDRFYTSTVIYGENPIVFLVVADCQARELVFYDLYEPESALPARDLFGQPVVAPNGKTYRLDESKFAKPPEWLHAFCETDWTAERKAVVSAQQH